MNYKRIIYIIPLILVITLVYFFTKNSSSKVDISNEGKEPELLLNLKYQKTKYRSEDKINILLKKKLNLEDYGIFNPLSVRTDLRGNIYILDFSIPGIIKISYDGKTITSFGKGKGKGPGELLNPTDFFIDNNQNIWVVDPVLGEVIKFNNKGTLIDIFKISIPAYRIVVFSPIEYLLVVNNFKRLFQIYESGNLKDEFGNIISEQEKYSILLSGIIAIDNRQNIYYVTDRSNLFFSFSKEGKERFTTLTIGGDKILPKINMQPSGFISLPRTFTNLDIKAYDNEIMILGRNINKKIKNTYLDIYSVSNGLYKNTITIPEKVLSFDIRGDSIYLINNTNLFIFEKFLKN